MTFKKAEKKGILARIALCGPTGAGKTYWGLEIASALANGRRIAVIDTEHGAASKYADLFDFDVAPLVDDFSPQRYVSLMKEITADDYGATLIDSLSHAWLAILKLTDEAAIRMKTKNSYAAWRETTPLHNNLIEAMLAHPTHEVVTMRSKMEYSQEKNDRTNKTSIVKLGLQPIQRDGTEYEFDIVGDIDADHNMIITKTRCSAIADRVYPGNKDGLAAFMGPLLAWLGEYQQPKKGGDLPQQIPPTTVSFGRIKNAMAYLREHEVEGYHVEKRRRDSVLAHLNVAATEEAITALQPNAVYQYAIWLENKVTKHKEKQTNAESE